MGKKRVVEESESSSESDKDDASLSSSSEEENGSEVDESSSEASEYDYDKCCCPVVCKTFSDGLQPSQRGRACQICLYEGRGVVNKDVVVCAGHKVRVCADIPKNDR